MNIEMDIDWVDGAFDTDTGKLKCVQSAKHAQVDLCFDTGGIFIGFAKIVLHKDRWVSAEKVFPDAVKLGEEICRRWNECAPIPGKDPR